MGIVGELVSSALELVLVQTRWIPLRRALAFLPLLFLLICCRACFRLSAFNTFRSVGFFQSFVSDAFVARVLYLCFTCLSHAELLERRFRFSRSFRLVTFAQDEARNASVRHKQPF